MGKVASGISMATKGAAKGAKEAVKKTPKAAEVSAKEVPAFKKQPGQTVTDPQRMAFPGVYKRPDVIAKEAAAMVAPESPSMKELFGVNREELYDISKGLKGNLPGELPGAAARPRGSEAAEKVMGKENTQRILDVLSEVEKYPELMKGMDSWYTMIPLYQTAVEVLGAERAKAEYPIMNALMGMASPGSAVTTEIPRGTAAYYLHKQGRFPEFMSELGKPVGLRNPGLDPEILGVPGHPYHKTAQGLPMQRFLESGEMQMESPKVPMYIEASGVPETGLQTRTPVGDAHFVRGIGLADVRTNKGFAGSITTPEMTSIAPWWREQVAGELGIESVPAQARTWGAFAPQTGVDTPIGAPKLELISDAIMEAAKRRRISPIEARDLWLQGKIRLGGDVGRAEGGPIDKEEMGVVDYGASSTEVSPQTEQRMRLDMSESRVRDLNQELQERIYAFQQGMISAEDLQDFFPGYSEFELSRMFGTTDTDLPRHDEMVKPRLTPKFLADALELENILRKENEKQLREGRKHPFNLRRDMPPGWETNLAEGGGVESPEGIPPIAQDLEMQYQAYKNGGQVQSRACEDFDRQLGKMIDFHAKLGGLVDGYAKGGAVRMSNGGTTPEDAPLMDEIAYMSQALSPEGESADSETAKKLRAMIKAGKVIATAVPKALAAPVVGVYGAATSGKFGTKEGVAAGEKRAEEFVKPSEETKAELQADPLAMEYLESVGKFMEELETKYKLPPLMPELFGVTMGTRGLGTQAKGVAKEAVGKVRDMAKELPPIPAGLSIQPVGQTTEQWLKSLEIPPKPQGSKMEVYAPADDLGLYSKMEKAALNFKRKEGTGEAWLADFKNAGVSDEELEYSGMKDILTRITQPMKRETIAVYAKQKRMPLQIVRATEGTDARDFKFAEAEVIDDVDYIKFRAADIEDDFETYYPGGMDGLREQVMKNFSDDELNDPNIMASIDETVEANKKRKALDLAFTEYYDNPYYRTYNDAGYEIVGNRDVGFTVRDPNGRYLIDRSRPGEEFPRTFSTLEVAESFANQHALDTGLMKESDVKFSKYQLDRGTDYEEMKIILPQPLGKRPFHSDHWDEEDVLSHYRRQRRVDTSGKPMMYIDEIQSDWHQAGRDRGYLDQKNNQEYQEIIKQKREIDRQVESLDLDRKEISRKKIKEIENQIVEELGLEPGVEIPLKEIRRRLDDLPEIIEINNKIEKLFKDRNALSLQSKKYEDLVSDAPFKDTWHELTVKTILHDAAQQGFERVGFSAAKPHIDRWGTEEYAWEKVPEGWKIVANEQRGGQAGGVNLEAEARARGILKSRDGDIIKTKEDLKRIVELTLREPWPAKVERITNKVWNSMQKKDVGLHQPRKEGMLYFYDEALKKYLQKYAKKIGAEFYETETQTGYGVSDQGPKAITEKVYMFEFTPKAKDTALKGQPYKKGGAVKKMRDGGPIVSDYNTIPDYNDAGAIKLAAYEQELKRYA